VTGAKGKHRPHRSRRNWRDLPLFIRNRFVGAPAQILRGRMTLQKRDVPLRWQVFLPGTWTAACFRDGTVRFTPSPIPPTTHHSGRGDSRWTAPSFAGTGRFLLLLPGPSTPLNVHVPEFGYCDRLTVTCWRFRIPSWPRSPCPSSHFADQNTIAKLPPPMPRNTTRPGAALARRFEAKLRWKVH
jgi:hypothetical protein